MKYADDATSPCSTTCVPLGTSRIVALRMNAARCSGVSWASGLIRAASRSKSASVAGRIGKVASAGAAAGRLEPRRGLAPGVDAQARRDEREQGGHDQQDGREDDHHPDVDDVGETGAGHAEQEDDVAHDVEGREHAAAHLARGVPLQERGSAKPTTAS